MLRIFSRLGLITHDVSIVGPENQFAAISEILMIGSCALQYLLAKCQMGSIYCASYYNAQLNSCFCNPGSEVVDCFTCD